MPVPPGEVVHIERRTAPRREDELCVQPPRERIQGGVARLVSGTRRRLRSVFGSFTRPLATTRRMYTTAASRSASRHSSAANSPGHKPVSAANTIIGP